MLCSQDKQSLKHQEASYLSSSALKVEVDLYSLVSGRDFLWLDLLVCRTSSKQGQCEWKK